MDMNKKYRIVFECAKKFLSDEMAKTEGLSEAVLKEHLNQKAKFKSIEDATERMVESLANRNMMASVIGFKKRRKEITEILEGFDAPAIVKKYKDSDQLLNEFKTRFDLKNVDGKRSLWKKFAEGIISGTRFMAAFKDKKEFGAFVQTFSLNKYTKAALPMLLSKEIRGFGFALACDFLKELGYRDYPKPDRHLIKIFTELNLSPSKEPFEVYKRIVEMSDAVGEDAFTVDKYFWLIASGRFDLAGIKTGRKRDECIKYGKRALAGNKIVF